MFRCHWRLTAVDTCCTLTHATHTCWCKGWDKWSLERQKMCGKVFTCDVFLTMICSHTSAVYSQSQVGDICNRYWRLPEPHRLTDEPRGHERMSGVIVPVIVLIKRWNSKDIIAYVQHIPPWDKKKKSPTCRGREVKRREIEKEIKTEGCGADT